MTSSNRARAILDDGVIAAAALIAQCDLCGACAVLRDDAHVVGRVQFFFNALQLRGESGRARLFGAQERFEVGELALDGEDARRRALGFSADQNRTANDVAVERDECGVRPLLRAIDRLPQIADDVGLGNRAADSIGNGAFADARNHRVPVCRGHSCPRLVRNDERPASSALLPQPLDRFMRDARVLDDRRFRNIAQQVIERRFKSLRGAHGFGGRRRIRNQFEDCAAHVLILRFQRCEQGADGVDLVRGLRHAIARAGQRLAHGIALRLQLIAPRYSMACGVLRRDECRFSRVDRGVPLTHRRARAVATLGRLARRGCQFAEVELAFLDRHFDLMHLIARLGKARDRTHQRLAAIRKRLLVSTHFVRFFLTLALELLPDLAEPIAFRARICERLCFFVEQSLLLGSFVADVARLPTRDFDPRAQIGRRSVGLLQERSETLDFAGDGRDFFASGRRPPGAIREKRAIFGERSVVGRELRGEIALAR